MSRVGEPLADYVPDDRRAAQNASGYLIRCVLISSENYDKTRGKARKSYPKFP